MFILSCILLPYFNKKSFLLFKAATLKLVTETKTYDVLSDNRLLPSPDRHHLSTSGYNWTCLVVVSVSGPDVEGVGGTVEQSYNSTL